MTTPLIRAATDLLGALSVAARAEVSASLDFPGWTRWSYLPGDRPGLSLEHADPELLGHVNDLLVGSHSERC